MSEAESDLALAQKVLDSRPFGRLPGARITASGDGAAVLEVDLRDEAGTETLCASAQGTVDTAAAP